MADIDPALVEKVLDIAQRERKTDVHHHTELDDFGRCLEVAKRVFGHFLWPTALPYSLKPSSTDNTVLAIQPCYLKSNFMILPTHCLDNERHHCIQAGLLPDLICPFQKHPGKTQADVTVDQ